MRASAILCAVIVLSGCGGSDEGGGRVAIDSPDDGATTPSPVRVELSGDGLGDAHFHLFVDAACDEPGKTFSAAPARIDLDEQSETDVALAPGEHTLCAQAAGADHVALAPTDEVTFRVAAGGAGSPLPTETEAQGESEHWEGTIDGDIKSGPNCDAAKNVGDFTVDVTPEGRVSGNGSVTATEFTCRFPEGSSTIPEQTITYRITGEKRPTQFLLTFSNGQPTVRLNITGAEARGSVDFSAGDYIARSRLTMRCLDC